MGRHGTAAPHRGRLLRGFVSGLIIAVWLGLAAIGGPYFGRVSEVSSNDQAAYLPSSAESTRVNDLLPEFSDSDAIPAVVVFTSPAELSESQIDTLEEKVAELPDVDGVGEDVSPLLISDDGVAAHAYVPVESEDDLVEVVDAIRSALAEAEPDDIRVFVTGPAGFTADLVNGFSGIDGLLLAVALIAVFLILIAVYRSFLLPLVVLATSVFALTVALLSVWWLANWDVFPLSGQTQGILFILVIGAATDYSLLYVARYREELRANRDTWTATKKAWRGTVEPVLASGGTVIAGLMCLILSDLKSNSSLGPIASIGIVFAMVSALTLLPAALLLLGRAAFWPRRPRFEPDAASLMEHSQSGALWTRVSRWVTARPRTIWISTTAILLLGCLGLTQLNANGVAQSDLVLGNSQARDGQIALGEHFPGGSGSPVMIAVEQDELDDAATTLLDHPGIDGVSIAADDSPTGQALVTEDGIEAMGPPGTPAPEPTVVDGRVMLQATLTDAADSEEAQDTVRDLRASFEGSSALVGGVSAVALDTNDASIHDRTLIIPLVLAVILLILMALLRSIFAPVLLVLTTVLSFGTALGVAALVFNDVLGFPGADPAVPLFAFVFLVALGIDYNIFLMTRVREESLAHGTRDGVVRGLRVTGGVITSAGLVLAATFAALAVIPILFLAQIAFIVAFGVLLDAFLVRAFLVPALIYDLGRVAWWPSRLSRAGM